MAELPVPSPAVRVAAAADSAVITAAVTAATVPMLRCMSECRDVQFAVMRLLTLADLGALGAACRSWRRWLIDPPLIGGLHFEFTQQAERVILLARCGWARPLVTTVRLDSGHMSAGSHFLLGGAGTHASEFFRAAPLQHHSTSVAALVLGGPTGCCAAMHASRSSLMLAWPRRWLNSSNRHQTHAE